MSSARLTSTPAGLDDRSDADMSGRRLGDYQLLRRLGRGGMAEVYLAEQLSLRRQVALKVLRRNLAGDTAYIRRFQHEARAAAGLVHANIVQIHEVGCVDGTYYIAQEYVPGQNLKQVLSRMGHGLDAVQAVNIIRQVAAALHKAGEANIIHRDIKPENIMIAPTGEVKVADFGLARVARDGEALNLTQVGITMGTPLYMSPEQVEGKPVDPRSDLYSFGVTCYHMLAGRTPFDGDTALAVAVQHLKTEPKRLEVLRPDLPEGLCRVVHKMLAKKPGDRYQSAIELLRDLKALKIEGLDQDWTADLPGFHSADLALSASGRLAATQQLDRLLREQLARRQQQRSAVAWVLLALALVVGGGLVGGLAALSNRPPPLMQASADTVPDVKRFDSVDKQYMHAQLANTEQAWRAITSYFPPEESLENRRYARMASRELANLYLSKNQLYDALLLYEGLASVEETETDFRLAGWVGQAAVYRRLPGLEYQNKLNDLMPDIVVAATNAQPGNPQLADRIGHYLAEQFRYLIDELDLESGAQ